MYILYFALFAAASSEFVTKKFCKDVDQEQCSVLTAAVYPCGQGPAYCTLKAGKKYAISLDLTPKFSAERLQVSIKGDIKNDGGFSRVIQGAKDACGYLTCPVLAYQRRIFDLDFTMDKTAFGKFPVQVKMWNPANETQACCFTFNAKA